MDNKMVVVGVAVYNIVDENKMIWHKSQPIMSWGKSQADAEFDWKNIIKQEHQTCHNFSILTQMLDSSDIAALKDYLNS